jgi:hypothetical protein
MTKQVYRSAQGKTVDLGAIKLRNEHVRAVGNMNVNARGDVLDSNNNVIEAKSRQIQKQNAKLTNVSDSPVHTSSAAVKRARASANTETPSASANTVDVAPVDVAPVQDTVVESTTPTTTDTTPPTTGGGLAAAIARSKIVKQEKEKTARQIQQETPGVRKI